MAVQLPGHFGHATRIRLTPSDFVASSSVNGPYRVVMDADGGAVDTYYTDLICCYPIPQGYKCTHVYVYTETTDADGVDVYEGDIDDGDTTSLATNQTTNNLIDITDSNAGSDTNYIVINVSLNANDIYGAYVTIAPA